MILAIGRAARAATWLILAFLVLAPAQSVARRHEQSTGLPALRFAQAPPDFTYDVGGGPRRLAGLIGKPVVLNFWATWCEPCRAELAAFVALRATYGETVPLLTVSYEEPGVARGFVAQQHVDLPVIEDPQHVIFDRYSISTLPVTIVLAPDGTVTHVSVGELAWPELRDAVASVALTPPPSLDPAAPF